MQYSRKNETDIFWIASGGKFTIKDSCFFDKDGNTKEFGEILYGIRCSSYHDPEELDKLIHFGDNNQFGHTKEGKFIVNESLVQALLIVLFTDKENESLIDRKLYNDEQYLIFNNTNYPLHDFIGNREKLITLIKELKNPNK